MSEDDFGDDSFFIDDSFLREVDNITASAQSKSNLKPNLKNGTSFGRSVSTSTAVPSPRRGWTGIQRSHSGPSRQIVQPEPAGRPINNARSTFPSHPSSDDYDVIPIPAESLAAFDSFTSRPTPTPALGMGGTIPSSRLGLVRSTSNINNNFFQTHLNFRREKQSTKGKRWDRTEFAESGRRVNAKGKGKGNPKAKGKRKSGWADDEDDEDDEEMVEDEDDWGDVMAPAPKPFVDPNAPYEPQRHLPNSESVKEYIYPTNRPKRDYQFDIVKACFMDNCLVALPTGLGKTFVAGVVMLNFYRWFPSGKIVFLAPTRPLVNQQIEACQLSCGIPSKDAAVMTGSSVSAKERVRLWDERRVFYCTPQTLENDLKKGSVDPKDIVLAVFDEAHKASGSYAYTTILAYITAHHPFFRVLALTATPGADVPRVQAVVDALHISRIEIREAEAPEIRKYMNEKHTEKHFVQMGDMIEGFRDRWAALMKPYVAKLVEKDILTDRDLDCKRLRPFRLTVKRQELGRERNPGMQWCYGPLTALEKMSRAMGNLLEFSIGMFHTTLSEIAGGTDASGKKSNAKGSANSIRNNFEFQKLLRDIEAEMNMIRIGKDGRSKADRHPKMVKTLELLLAHFSQASEEEKTLGQKNDTRAMVFCSYRSCVLEIVDMLNQYSGLLRATKFVGQSQGKQEEDKGFNQKEQKKTINEFKQGKFNILVSTSIGEEGLDIGEVDFVIIYDMPKQSIKLLQRVGRTGRKRDGKVHVLMSEGREDANWDTAQQTHREIQEEILHSRNLELFEDVEPLLPPDKFPICVEQEMKIDEWNPDDKEMRKVLADAERYIKKVNAGAAKGKGKAGVGAIGAGAGGTKGQAKGRGHEVPEGAGGFRSVADLLRDAHCLPGQDNLDDVDDEVGPPAEKRAPRQSAPTKRKRGREPSPVRSDSSGEEEEQDLDTLFAQTETSKTTTKRVKRSTAATTKIKVARAHSGEERARKLQEKEERKREAEREQLNKSAMEFFNSRPQQQQQEQQQSGRGRVLTPPSSPDALICTRALIPPSPSPEADLACISNNNTGHDSTSGPGLSSPINVNRHTAAIVTNKLTPRTAAMAGFSQVDIDLSWDADDDDEDDEIMLRPISNPVLTIPASVSRTPMAPPPLPVHSSGPASASVPRRSRGQASPLFVPNTSSSPQASTSMNGNTSTPLPATQFPVRRLGLRRPRPILLSSGGSRAEMDTASPFANLHTLAPGSTNRHSESEFAEPESPVLALAAARGRKRQILPSSSPPPPHPPARSKKVSRQEKKSKVPRKIRHFMDMDAEISGSASSDTSEHSASSQATSSDERFAGHFEATQAPKGYNQRAMYLAGLGTQATGHGLNFKRDKAKERAEFLSKARKAVYVTDDEDGDGDGGDGQGRESANEYELGSFVVDDDDDEDMGFLSHSDPAY